MKPTPYSCLSIYICKRKRRRHREKRERERFFFLFLFLHLWPCTRATALFLFFFFFFVSLPRRRHIIRTNDELIGVRTRSLYPDCKRVRKKERIKARASFSVCLPQMIWFLFSFSRERKNEEIHHWTTRSIFLLVFFSPSFCTTQINRHRTDDKKRQTTISSLIYISIASPSHRVKLG